MTLQPNKLESSTVNARPNKEFFVSMLTRDIELQDAILDLLDNAIDGIHRTLGKNFGNSLAQKPFEGFWAKLSIAPDQFVIEDNCGGIPLDVAINKAFRMGRPPGHTVLEGTVGMYGIGMKRAIFKMGESARVESHHDETGFTVSITPDWMQSPEAWELPLTELLDSGLRSGTKITIEMLRQEVASRFDPNDGFLERLKKVISQQYGIIMSKGFQVIVNGVPSKPEEFALLSEPLINDPSNALHPYIYKGEIDTVAVEIYAGLYRWLPGEEELASSLQGRNSRDAAGWTIACNDRVVVYKDKGRLTGWGTAGVPSYHNQFIAFTGLVLLSSGDPWKLPLTTTKRGLDASSDLYAQVLDLMREATRTFTNFTNKWKKYPQQRDALYANATAIPLDALKSDSETLPFSRPRTGSSSRRYTPTLPKPPAADSEGSDIRISFLRARSEVEQVALHLFERADVAPGIVGDACFSALLTRAQED